MMNDASIRPSLDRLLLCNRVRELADWQRPVTSDDLSFVRMFLAAIVKGAYALGESLPRGRWGSLKRSLFIPVDCAVVAALRLLLYKLRFWRGARGTLGALYRASFYRGMRYYLLPDSEITGYVTSTDKEEPLIRVCLLLRTMRRYGACIEHLISRLDSGLPAEQTKYWLSFFLSEIKDQSAAELLCPRKGRPEACDYVPDEKQAASAAATVGGPSRLRYGVVIPTMFDSDVFRGCILSLLESDFHGQIVVVEEGNRPEKQCESFCSQLPVTYVKNSEWTGPSAAVNLGIGQLDQETDIVIYCHSDVLWPPRWFSQLDHAWNQVCKSGKVGAIHLGFMQFRHYADAALRELFIKGDYADLIWLLRAMKDAQPLVHQVQDVQVRERDAGRLFGLATDEYDGDMARARLKHSESFVATSFPLQFWRGFGGLDPALSVGMQAELLYHCFASRKWSLRMNNPPLVHLQGSDTGRIAATGEKRRLSQMNRETYEGFANKYGWEIEHLLFTYSAETSVIYHDDIISAANELRFSDIDFVFDDLFHRLEHKKLANCEITWCRSRAICKYV